MKIIKSIYRSPDSSSGDVSFEVSVDIENKSKHIVESSKSSVVIIDDKENAVASEYDREENSYAENGETFNIDMNPYGAKEFYFDDIKKSKAIVDVTTFKREFLKLGEYGCPKDHKTVTRSDKSLEFGKLRIFGIVIYRNDPPEDASDDHAVCIKLTVKNLSDEFIQKVMCKVQLFDRSGSNIVDSEDTRPLPPSASVSLEPSVYAKSGKLKGSKIVISLSSYHVLEHLKAENMCKLSND